MSAHQPVDRPRNPFATAGLVVAGVGVLIQVGLSAGGVLLPLAARGSGTSLAQVGIVFAAIGVLLLILSAVAAALGLVGLQGRRGHRAAAGAATGIGAAGVITSLANLVVPPLLGALVQL